MIINKIRNNNQTFGAGRANILATADNHGNLKELPRVLQTIENNAEDIFVKGGDPSTQNFFVVAGDWFINPEKKGFVTDPNLSNGELQKMALGETVKCIKNIIATKFHKKTFHFHSIYTMGNHCLDGGTDFIVKVMKGSPVTTLITNVDLDKSPKIKKAMDAVEKTTKIVKSRVYEIPDDKNSDLKHKILFVSATIPSMDFYNPEICDGLEFYDNSNVKDADLTEEHLKNTINAIKDEVDKFKQDNPHGVVVLLSHMGGRLSEVIQKNVPQINHILNGHDHENTQTNVGKTSINSLGKDNEMIKAINIEFDDEGNCTKSTMTPYFPQTTLADGLSEHPMQKFLSEYLGEDEEPILSLREYGSNSAIRKEKSLRAMHLKALLADLGYGNLDGDLSKVPNERLRTMIEEEVEREIKDELGVSAETVKLTYGNEIRHSNSILMNFLTSAIKDEIQSKYDKDVVCVGIPSSMVRGGLRDGANNLEVMKVFDSVSEKLSELYTVDLTGEEIVRLIIENVQANLEAPTRNTLIHWSDFQIDKGVMKDIFERMPKADFQTYINNHIAELIKVRDNSSQTFEDIVLGDSYRVVLPRKYLIKTDIEVPQEIVKRAKPLETTYDNVFRDYLEDVKYKISITPKTKETRVVE